MLDIKFVRENPEVVKQNIRNKFQDSKLELVDKVLELDKENREIKQEVEALRAERNKISKQIGALMGQGKREEAEEVKKQVAASGTRIEELSQREKEVEEELLKDMMVIPNIIDRYRRIDNVWNNHHVFEKFFFYFFFSCRKFINTCTGCSNLFLNFFCFITFSLCHQRTDLFGSFISFCSQSFNFLFDLSVFFVQFNNLINQFQFIVLEFVSDILFNDFRIFSHKFNV